MTSANVNGGKSVLQKCWWLLFGYQNSISLNKRTKPRISKQISVLKILTNKNLKDLLKTQKNTPSTSLKPFYFHSAGISLGTWWEAVRKTRATYKIRQPLGSIPFLRTQLPAKQNSEMSPWPPCWLELAICRAFQGLCACVLALHLNKLSHHIHITPKNICKTCCLSCLGIPFAYPLVQGRFCNKKWQGNLAQEAFPT